MTRILALAAVLVLIAVPLAYWLTISRRAEVRHRAWSMRWRIWLRLRPGPGFVTLTELWFRWGKVATLSHGKRARPSLPFWRRAFSAPTRYAVRFGRAQWGRPAYGRMQDQVLILAPPQSGKSGILADRILDHPGPVVCTSTRDDLFTNTAGERARLGPVETFNPLGIGGIPSTFAWDIIDGCEDPATAIRRAQDLTGDYPTGDMHWWQSKASAALASMLHAAALAPWANMQTVYGWVNLWDAAQAEEILTTVPGASRELAAVFREVRDEGKTAASVRATITESLTWVAVPALAAAVNPPPGAAFDVTAFLQANGTLYMIAPGTETAPIAPLFQAFVQHVHYEGGLLGSHGPAQRLDPPLLLALDELTQICPLPLPSILADSAGKGILVASVIHSIGQLDTRWGQYGADTIWNTSGTKMLMSGITDAATLEHVSRLAGSVYLADEMPNAPVMPPELLRMLPRWRALILTLNNRPAIVKTRPAWHRRNRWFHRSPVPAPMLAPALAPLRIAHPAQPVPTAPLAHNGHPPA
jgi:type IV secretion system protein VirD4